MSEKLKNDLAIKFQRQYKRSLEAKAENDFVEFDNNPHEYYGSPKSGIKHYQLPIGNLLERKMSMALKEKF